MGRGAEERNVVAGAASGPFAQAPDAGDKRGGLFVSGRGVRSSGGGGGGGVRIKTDGSVAQYKSRGDGDGGGEYSEPIYPEELEEGDEVAPRTNIEHINLISDDEDDDVVITGQSRVSRRKGKGAAGRHAMNPIRLTRHEHKARVIHVNTDSSTGGPMTDMNGGALKVEEHDDDGLFISQDRPIVKTEPGVQGGREDVMEIDALPTSHFQNGFDVNTSSSSSQRQETSQPVPKAAPESPITFPGSKAKEPVIQTEEDKAEYARHLEDIEILARELGGMRTAEPPRSDTDIDGDLLMNDGNRPVQDPKEGRLYLFQFPPILPKLVDAAHTVKPDPGEMDVQLRDIPSGTIDLDATPEVKAEPAAETDASARRPASGPSVKDALVQEPGLIGKLVVRRSGKVELSWGGTSLALERGAEFDFLTTGVVLQGLGVNKGEEGGVEMSGTGMGRIMGKIVATPDWEKLFG